MVLRDFTAESRPFPVPTLAALVPLYYLGATHFPQAMTTKEAECAPIQNEPVDLSVKKSSNPSSPSMSPRLLSLSFPSPASSPPSSCIDLRLHSARHPGDDTSNSADEHSHMRTYLSFERIKQASFCNTKEKMHLAENGSFHHQKQLLNVELIVRIHIEKNARSLHLLLDIKPAMGYVECFTAEDYKRKYL